MALLEQAAEQLHSVGADAERAGVLIDLGHYSIVTARAASRPSIGSGAGLT